jgi:hypothetical protein
VADPKRLVIVKHVCAHLQAQVAVANGAHYDLDNVVYRGRSTFSEDDPLPAISILDTLNPDRDTRPNNTTRSVQTETYALLVQGWVPEDRENPTDPAHRLMADVKKALAMFMDPRDRSNYLMPTPDAPGGLVLSMEIEPGIVRPPDQVSSRAYFYLRFLVTFKESLADPYKLT